MADRNDGADRVELVPVIMKKAPHEGAQRERGRKDGGESSVGSGYIRTVGHVATEAVLAVAWVGWKEGGVLKDREEAELLQIVDTEEGEGIGGEEALRGPIAFMDAGPCLDEKDHGPHPVIALEIGVEEGWEEGGGEGGEGVGGREGLAGRVLGMILSPSLLSVCFRPSLLSRCPYTRIRNLYPSLGPALPPSFPPPVPSFPPFTCIVNRADVVDAQVALPRAPPFLSRLSCPLPFIAYVLEFDDRDPHSVQRSEYLVPRSLFSVVHFVPSLPSAGLLQATLDTEDEALRFFQGFVSGADGGHDLLDFPHSLGILSLSQCFKPSDRCLKRLASRFCPAFQQLEFLF